MQWSLDVPNLLARYDYYTHSDPANLKSPVTHFIQISQFFVIFQSRTHLSLYRIFKKPDLICSPSVLADHHHQLHLQLRSRHALGHTRCLLYRCLQHQHEELFDLPRLLGRLFWYAPFRSQLHIYMEMRIHSLLHSTSGHHVATAQSARWLAASYFLITNRFLQVRSFGSFHFDEIDNDCLLWF